MKRLAAVFLAVVLSIFSSAAQSGFPPYHSRTDFLMASPGAVKYGLYGYDNPALLATLDRSDLLFTWTDAGGRWRDFNRWGLFSASPNLGFGLTHQKAFGSSVTDYRIATALGNRTVGFGFAYGWSGGNTAAFGRSSVLTAGALLRPGPFLSFGVHGSAATRGDDREAVLDAGLRPLRTELLTLFADYALRNGQSFSNGAWSAGAVLEPLPGIRIAARYFDTKELTVGLQVSLGFAGLSTHARYDRDGKYNNSTYGIRLGGYDRTVVRWLGKKKKYVELDLNGPLKYRRFRFFDRTQTLTRLLALIEDAKNDPAVGGLAINASGISANRALLWEVREKLEEFRSTGKQVVVYIDRGNIDLYHFASVADKIVLDPAGILMLEGYVWGRTYFKGTLAKLGIAFDEWRFFKYKSANEGFSRESMSDADREQLQALTDDYYRLARAEISESRGLEAETFDGMVNSEVVFMPEEALRRGLVDTLGRWEEVKTIVESIEGRKPSFISPQRLEMVRPPTDNRWGEPPQIAVIYALGVCAMDEGITARKLVKDVEAAVKSRRVKAIVLRVDSPGGDPLASDLIAEALRKAKGKKPVIVSQGFVAASGGYWLSMYADTIVAAPTTITGSIGVIGGWFYNDGLKEKLGLSTDLVKAGDHADLGFGFSLPFLGRLPDRNLTAEERGVMERMIKGLYKEFVEKVSAGRGRPYDQIEEIAQGRVWSGRDGLARGLVDVLGGLERAIAIARERAGLPPDAEIQILELPQMGLFDLSMFTPRLIGGKTRTEVDKLLEMIEFRLRHNGHPLPILPIEHSDAAGIR